MGTHTYEVQEVLIAKGTKFNTAVTADTDIFTAALSPSRASSFYPTIFRIYCTFDTAGVLSVRRTENGVTVTEEFNSGNELTPSAAYVFDILVNWNQTINLRYGVDATVLMLNVSEIGGGI